MNKEDFRGASIVASAYGLFNSVLENVRTRIELISLELADERKRFARLLILCALMLLLFSVGLWSAVAWLTFLFWEQRVWITGLFALVFLVSGLLVMTLGLRRICREPHPFETTVSELTEDIRQLKSSLHHDHH
jgi:uncharacterized membrane protein YqjE